MTNVDRSNRTPRWRMSKSDQAARWEMKQQIVEELLAAIDQKPEDRKPLMDAIVIVGRVERSADLA